jgi:hypothetical protein
MQIWMLHLFLFHAHCTRAQQQAIVGSNDATNGSSNSSSAAADLATTRCHVAKGDWCRNFHQQPPQAHTPVNQGNKSCLDDCLGRGICNK